MSLRGVKRRSSPICVIAVFAVVSFISFSDLFACPSGQSCPAGKDCISDPTQCVVDSSTTTTTSSSSGTSSEPTTVKDQLGLTFDPQPYFQFGDGSGASDIGLEVDTTVRYQVDRQISVETSSSVLFSSDLANSETPSETGWVWMTGADAKF